MTTSEKIILFGLRYNDSSFTNDDIGEDEIILYLNLSVNRFIKTRFTGNNFRKTSFDEEQKRIDDLRTLLVVQSEQTTFIDVNEIVNSKEINIPSDYLFMLDLYVESERSDIVPNVNWNRCKQINISEINNHISNAFNKVYLREPLYTFRNENKITVINSTDEVLTKYKINYIKKPDVIDINTPSNLPEHTHEEIVEIAVGLALEEKESPRYQTHTDKLNKIE